MTVHPSVIVGVFPTHQQAEQAVGDLLGRGFSSGQMSYMGAYARGGFLEGLVRAISGGPDAIDVAGQLIDLGLPTEQAEFYAREHSAGRSILAVEPRSRGTVVREIMQNDGAYNYSNVPGTQAMPLIPPTGRHAPGEAVHPERDEIDENA